MKKAILLPGLAILAAIAMTGCATYNSVSVTQAAGVDFHKAFHTYQWLPDKGDTLNTAYNNEIIRGNIHQAIVKELSVRKLHPAADDASADLSLQLVVQNIDRVRDNARFAPAFYLGPFGGTYTGNRSYYAHNRLTLNVYDRKTNRLVWTCTAEGDLSGAKDFAKNIEPAVAKIMKKYPVQPTQKPV